MTTAVRSRRLEDMILVIVFGAMLVAPLADAVFKLDPLGPLDERRLMAERPGLPRDRRALRTFPKRFEEYYNDRFGFRSSLVFMHWYVKLHWMRVTPSTGVVLGREGWLFGGTPAEVDHYRGRFPFSEEELSAWQRVLEERRDWLAKRNIRYLFFVTPLKYSIYSEYMPDALRPLRDDTRLDQWIDHMRSHSTVAVLDLRQALRAARGPDDLLYFKYDGHWNTRGAFAAHRPIIDRLSEWFPELSAVRFEVDRTRYYYEDGALARMMGLHRQLREPDVRLSVAHPRAVRRTLGPDDFLMARRPWPRGDIPYVMERSGADLPRAVMFRDSFTNAMIPFLSEHFSRIAFIWRHFIGREIFDVAIIDRERPDVVIEQMNEVDLMKPVPENPDELRAAQPAYGPEAEDP